MNGVGVVVRTPRAASDQSRSWAACGGFVGSRYAQEVALSADELVRLQALMLDADYRHLADVFNRLHLRRTRIQ